MAEPATDEDPRLDLVRREVADRDPVDVREATAVEEILAALGSLDHPFDTDADPTHVTGSALVVGPRGIVLHRHKRLGLWLQPGGHLDPGEWPAEAALREAAEETGLTSLRHPQGGPVMAHVDAHDGGRGHRHLDLRYVLLAGSEDPSPPAGESPDCAWFDLGQAHDMADPGLSGVILTLVRWTRT